MGVADESVVGYSFLCLNLDVFGGGVVEVSRWIARRGECRQRELALRIEMVEMHAAEDKMQTVKINADERG
ncbi:hypothetical protein FLK61_33390 [Paenalkalicoccus suaedae]|uniref:Uncharacterized protein n=1 Tax=Paenalkalicoccus suaedae TaxID=2592382 RepID=A0A859FHA3_9BACI|nr:hypothetical protein [Paenalkalicoccus suaedae]QKS71585.1 hypothetical protein FLK61_33390 [Paenalkalicoccus suaedae]